MEFGVKLIQINASNYDSDQELCVAVASQLFEYSPWWQNWIYWHITLLVFFLIDGYNSIIKSYKRRVYKIWRWGWILCNIGYKLIDLYLDWYYCFQIPHSNGLTAGVLLFNWLQPYYMLFIMIYIIVPKYPQLKFARTFSEYMTGFWECGNEINYKIYEQHRTKIVAELMHKGARFIIFYLDVFYVGSFWNSFLIVLPIFSYLGILTIWRTGLASMVDTAFKK